MSTPTEAPVGRHARPPAAALVKLTGVGKRYGAVIALHDITMEVGASEVTCVLGDNGAGKSTLIKIIAGLHQPSTGSYEVDGTPVSFSSPREALERGIATVYQEACSSDVCFGEISPVLVSEGELEHRNRGDLPGSGILPFLGGTAFSRRLFAMERSAA